jgi:AmmeMemoRadiSam system protein B
MSEFDHIRKAGVAGSFYSADQAILEREIALYLENSIKRERQRPVRALICPHAGYLYSGGVAARAYRQIHGEEFPTVVVIAPSHEDAFRGISVFAGAAYTTPFGSISVDEEVAARLAWNPQIERSLNGHSEAEHSLEVQLPFLQEVIAEPFMLVPISMGEQNYQTARRLAHHLHEAVDPDKTLVVASSDLSHNYSDEIARQKDSKVKAAIDAFDILGLAEKIENKEASMCGSGPVLAAMIYARLAGATKSEVLLYRNSSDVTGDRANVVGYLSAMLY